MKNYIIYTNTWYFKKILNNLRRDGMRDPTKIIEKIFWGGYYDSIQYNNNFYNYTKSKI